MQKTTLVKSTDMFKVVKELLDNGQTARITVTGMSMYPLLRENIDSVELSKEDYRNIKRGDIVLARNEFGQYILHRILKKDDKGFIMLGDGLKGIDRPYNAKCYEAVSRTVWRKNKRIDCNKAWWKIIVFLWMNFRPLSRFTFRVLRKTKNILGIRL